jgi:ketosteroid isomerase-like protein
MTQPMNSSPSDVVRDFYDAVARRDAGALADLTATHFRDDAAAVWPDGLPYGGRVVGARRLARLFAAMAWNPDPTGPEGLEVLSVVDGGDQVAAQLTFRWRAPGSAESIPSGALELWTFTDGLVSEIRAYYWDTAACQDLVRNTTTSLA